MSNLLEDYVGGINIPTITYLGTGVDLEATVADIMKVGALSGSLISGIGGMFNSLGDVFGGQGLMGILNRLEVGQRNTVTRGTGLIGDTLSGTAVSTTSYVGNTSSSDLLEASMVNVEDQKQRVMPKAEEGEVTLQTINQTANNIYELLKAGIRVSFQDTISYQGTNETAGLY